MPRCNNLKNGHLPERDDVENQRNNYKTDEGNRKGKFCHSLVMTYNSCKLHGTVKTVFY